MKLKKIRTVYNIYIPFCVLLFAFANTVGLAFFKQQLANTFFLNWYLALVIALATFSFAFHIYIKEEQKEIIDFLSTVYKKYQYLLFLYFLFILFFIYLLNPGGTGTLTVQLCFLNFILFLLIYTFVQYKHKELTGEQLIRLLIILGIALRFIYILYNPHNFRQHDVDSQWGHGDYINYIYKNKTLPPESKGLFYHPPVHHILSAMVLALGHFMSFNDYESLRLLQFAMLILSSLTLIFFYKSLQELNCNLLATGIAVTLFAFYPSNIYLASWINNDNTLFFFYMLSFYWLLKWRSHPTFLRVMVLAVFVALASLTKKVGLFLIPLTLITIFFEGFKKWQNRKQEHNTPVKRFLYLKMIGVFLLIAIPLSLSFQLRQYLLYNQSLLYVPVPPLKVIPTTWYNLFHFPVADLFSNPYPANPVNGQNDFFLYYLFQSALFGEWNYPGLETIAVLLVITSLLNLIFLFIYFSIPQQGRYWGEGYIFLMNMVLLSAALFKFRIDSPFVCTQNFRYITPVLISTAYFTGQAFHTLARKNKWLSRFLAWPWLVLNSLFSLLFISLTGMPR